MLVLWDGTDICDSQEAKAGVRLTGSLGIQILD